LHRRQRGGLIRPLQKGGKLLHQRIGARRIFLRAGFRVPFGG
jgi:hypothetical protein